MKYAVIYARYSSDRQNEMSIEGQIEKCRSYADEHDMVIVQEYIDRAQTATTDKRPEFLRMISDSENRTFDTILVYQLDRFARNKDDSGYYKKILRENGVKVVSAMEQIASDSSGVITELKKRHSLEKNKQITIDPEVVRKFLKAIRKGNIKNLQYKKMLVKVLIDKVYLYDDHVTVILQNNGSKKTDSENSIDVIEDYFSGECSGMNLTGAP